MSILLLVGPYLIPRAIAFYRSIRSGSQGAHSAIRPPPPRVQRALNVLFAATVVSLVFTLPHFAPENLFQSLNARLALPTNLFNVRLNALRGAAGLGEDDKMFLSKLESEGDKWRLIYAAYGADAALHCPFCTVSEPKTYMYYALAAIALPHLAHVFLLGLITSSFFSGPEGSRWRTYATIAGVSLALLEFYATWNYRWEANAQTRILAEVDFFAQRMRVYRHLAFAACDALLGWMLYLTSTNRWLVKPPSTTEQLSNSHNRLPPHMRRSIF